MCKHWTRFGNLNLLVDNIYFLVNLKIINDVIIKARKSVTTKYTAQSTVNRVWTRTGSLNLMTGIFLWELKLKVD